TGDGSTASGAGRSITGVAVGVKSGSCTSANQGSGRGPTGGLVRRCEGSVTHLLDDVSSRLRQEVFVDEGVEVTVQDGLGVARLVAGAVVLDQLVGVEDIAADGFAPEARVRRGGPSSFLRQGRLAFLLGPLDESS